MEDRLIKRENVFILVILLISTLIINIWIKSALANTPVSDGFDYPLGAPNGKGYKVWSGESGLDFLELNDYQKDGYPEYHPGEDWNDDNTGDDWGCDSNDAGDPVHVISNGIVKYADYRSKGWGNIVLIEHKARPGQKFVLPDGTEVDRVWSGKY